MQGVIGLSELLLMKMFMPQRLVVVDVREKEAFRQGHIKHALSLPIEVIDKESKALLGTDRLIVVYCDNRSCRMSTVAAEKLRQQGFAQVFEYQAGLEDYKAAQLPLQKKGGSP